MQATDRKNVFRQSLVELVNAQIKSIGITPEEAATVFTEEAKVTLDCLEWKPYPQRAASEHLVAAAACLNDGRVIPVPGFDMLFPDAETPN
ncbi:hypothetical protein [Pandoraea oxalativorans]|uniref:Uncharacterized protein n=1 Tax=Pandoraea oxalativorans TaxID=573737 RepID=A0A0G3ICQ5_9BURK|nr:hypothetical protein [Pandoraea oxalativorans]AKK24964.1 hypothetical protein MB84_29805 [Pandoraea oxalativorans]